MSKLFTADFYQRNANAIAGLATGVVLMAMAGFVGAVFVDGGISDSARTATQVYFID